VQWDLVRYTITAESALCSEKVLKIGQHLAKLRARVDCTVYGSWGTCINH